MLLRYFTITTTFIHCTISHLFPLLFYLTLEELSKMTTLHFFPHTNLDAITEGSLMESNFIKCNLMTEFIPRPVVTYDYYLSLYIMC